MVTEMGRAAATSRDPDCDLRRENSKLREINAALMHRIEQSGGPADLAYTQFERAARLEAEVRERTRDLERTLELLHEANAGLAAANARAETAHANLAQAMESIEEGFALFGSDDRLVMRNSRFCRDLPDIRDQLHPGMLFGAFVERVSTSAHLALEPGETRSVWAKRRMSRHTDEHDVFNIALTLDRWLQISEHRTAGGGTVILQTDISQIIRDEREARDRLMARQARMVRATLDHINQGVCIFDRRLNLAGWNTPMEALLGRPLGGDVAGLSFTRLLDRLDSEIRFTRRFSRDRLLEWAGMTGPRPAIGFEITKGGDKTISVFGQEMPDRGFVISFTDITAERNAALALREMNETLERRVAERTGQLNAALEAAHRANASKTRFVAAASHDLLQPLSAAKLFLSFLENRGNDALARQTAAKAVSALGNVEAIIEALLDISRLDSGQAVMNIEDVRLADIFDALFSELAPAASAKGLELRMVPTSATVRSDPVFLRRILQNLVSNAVRYTERGAVLLGARRQGADVRIDVIDTGPGIAPQDQRAIFGEFRRLSPSRSGSGGLGLGLAIVERACASLGHDVQLQSQVGRGSTFSVAAERTTEADAILRRDEGTQENAVPDARDLVVLLVENDAEVAHAITLMIEGWGSHVIHAESGEDALVLLDEIEITPDRLLLDFGLGRGMSGIDLLSCLRAQYGDIPARIISADRGEALAKACASAGVVALPKPLDTKTLAAFLENG